LLTPHHRPEGKMKHVDLLKGQFNASLNLPGSKSITLRDAVLASLAQGQSSLEFPADCDDFSWISQALIELGITVHRNQPESVLIEGTGGHFRDGSVTLQAGLSGTAARFLIALALLRHDETTIDGLPPLRARPNQQLVEALSALGASVDSTNHGHLPISIQGPEACNASIRVKGNRSSQYLSALLLVGPLLPAGLEIFVEGELVSRPYIEVTLREMHRFGVSVERDGYRRFHVRRQTYNPAGVRVEGDASAASYHAALATIHGGSVTFTNLGKSSAQGDYRFLEICERLGAKVTRAERTTTIIGPPSGQMRPLDGDVNMENMPDTAPTLFAMAPLIPGGARMTGLKTLRIKECDRISVPAQQLRKIGVEADEGPDYLAIAELGSPRIQREVLIETHDDHRMAMSFAVLGTKLGNLHIEDSACVAKSYPRFWEDLESLYA
jgi:3-phosphoshikimate 1-carboxyvinyltransferase